MKLNRKNNKKGFTIVELVIVIGVIGILSAILIPTFANLTSQAQEAAAKEEVQNAYTSYVMDAVDNKLHNEDTPDDNTDDIAVTDTKRQDQVVVKRNEKYYVYNNGWTTTGAPSSDPTNSYGTYNGCVVFVKNA